MLRPAAAKAEQSSDNAVLSLDKGGTLEATSRDRKSSESLSRSRLTAPRVALVLGTRESLNLIKIYPAETFYVSGAEGREVGGGGECCGPAVVIYARISLFHYAVIINA